MNDEDQLKLRKLRGMTIHTFYQKDLPNGASHCSQDKCGFSIYRGVLIQWDEDHDERVLRVLDEIPIAILGQLLVVQEHKASVSFLWRDVVPQGYEEGVDFQEPRGDIWIIYKSTAVKGKLANRGPYEGELEERLFVANHEIDELRHEIEELRSKLKLTEESPP